MDYEISKIGGLFAATGTPLFLFLLIGAVLCWRKRTAKLGRIIVTVMAGIMAVCAFTPLQAGLSSVLEDRFPAKPALPEHIDGIIILGGMIRTGISEARGMPSVNDAADRLLEGARLAQLHPEAKLLFTGGDANPWGDVRIAEARFAAENLRAMGIAEDRILLESRSRNTYENMIYSREIAAPKPGENWILVTSALHMPRSVGIFRAGGWPVIPWPCNYLSGGPTDWSSQDLPILRLLFLGRTMHEATGLIYYRLRGWTDQLLPD
jgi:uncharacterized SAM-binding protein YcdF (DUF218 family)